MSQELVVSSENSILAQGDSQQFITMEIDGQLFGLPVLKVQDVLRPQKITKIPLAVPEIEGSLNLRGRIVTVLNMRKRLCAPVPSDDTHMNVVVEYKEDLYSLKVDSVGDVLTLGISSLEKTPSNLSDSWKEVSLGVYSLDSGKIMVVLDVERLLDFFEE